MSVTVGRRSPTGPGVFRFKTKYPKDLWDLNLTFTNIRAKHHERLISSSPWKKDKEDGEHYTFQMKRDDNRPAVKPPSTARVDPADQEDIYSYVTIPMVKWQPSAMNTRQTSPGTHADTCLTHKTSMFDEDGYCLIRGSEVIMDGSTSARVPPEIDGLAVAKGLYVPMSGRRGYNDAGYVEMSANTCTPVEHDK